jgi:AraC-like DNA-binding protein
MIETPISPRRHDRLTAFVAAFGIRAQKRPDGSRPDVAQLSILGDEASRPAHIVFRSRGHASHRDEPSVLAAVGIDFGGSINPLVGALPDELRIPLADSAGMAALATMFVAENDVPRCGGATVRDRLSEVIVVMAIRQAIAAGTVHAGLLAGLAHAALCPCLVAMHDDPGRPWRVDALARLAGMSRSHFTATFAEIVGDTPLSYLNAWRLALGHSRLSAGRSVKAVAAQVGFGSQAAFSRAFSRRYGYPPSAARQAT